MITTPPPLHLTDRQRVVIEHYIAGHSRQEVAACLAIHPNAVHLLMTRARRRNALPSFYALVAAYATQQALDGQVVSGNFRPWAVREGTQP